MAFRLESEMQRPAAAWLQSKGLFLKTEFVTPWGICDLVGASFVQRHIQHRLKLRQYNALGSPIGVALLLRVPDVETGRSVSADGLVREFVEVIDEPRLRRELHRLIRGRFLVATETGQLQRFNGWMPLHKTIVAVELKLSRVDEAFHQARNHLQFADKSYVGFPISLAERIVTSPMRRQFCKEGVGILAIGRRKCDVILPARYQRKNADPVAQMYSVEKFWRTRAKDKTA